MGNGVTKMGNSEIKEVISSHFSCSIGTTKKIDIY